MRLVYFIYVDSIHIWGPVFQPIEKKDRKVKLDDFLPYEYFLNKEIKRKKIKYAKKEVLPKVEKDEN